MKCRVLIGKEYLKRGDADFTDVLDFFDTVGMLLKRGDIDKELVWNSFYTDFNKYYLLSQKFVKAQQVDEDDPLLWENVAYLHKILTELETVKRGKAPRELSAAKLLKFKKEESEIEY